MRAGAVDSRLEAIAGVPVGIRTTIGTTVLPTMGALEDRILYAVVRIVDTTGSYNVPASIGTLEANGRFRQRQPLVHRRHRADARPRNTRLLSSRPTPVVIVSCCR